MNQDLIINLVPLDLISVSHRDTSDCGVYLNKEGKPRQPWKDATVRYLTEMAHKASIGEDKWHFRWLDRYFGSLFLDQITEDVLVTVRKARLAEGVSNARCNRLFALIRAVLRKAANE